MKYITLAINAVKVKLVLILNVLIGFSFSNLRFFGIASKNERKKKTTKKSPKTLISFWSHYCCSLGTMSDDRWAAGCIITIAYICNIFIKILFSVRSMCRIRWNQNWMQTSICWFNSNNNNKNLKNKERTRSSFITFVVTLVNFG